MTAWIDELERLARLHQSGALTASEFELAKSKLLGARSAAPVANSASPTANYQRRVPKVGHFGYKNDNIYVTITDKEIRLKGVLRQSRPTDVTVPLIRVVSVTSDVASEGVFGNRKRYWVSLRTSDDNGYHFGFDSAAERDELQRIIEARMP